MKRFLWLGFVLLVYIICTGCGETYRPIIIPNPPVFPNPKAAHTVLSINDNGTVVQGTGMVVDVSGDTDQSIANMGVGPVHAVQQSAGQVLVVNHPRRTRRPIRLPESALTMSSSPAPRPSVCPRIQRRTL